MDIKELFEKKYAMNAPSWSLERDPDGSYKYHATQSAFVLFEQQQIEIESLKVQLKKAQAVPESNALLSASLDAIQKLGSGDFVLVPVDTLNKALNPNDYDEAVCSANDLLAIIEAQEQSHENG